MLGLNVILASFYLRLSNFEYVSIISSCMMFYVDLIFTALAPSRERGQIAANAT